ncbi:RDD family protein [Agromyces aureus]|uniref:FHA domain-containing protein n=1 Tax=Agromyces aureus TaxID=453304 RepID=A0A191WHW7_9MICO|nr:RDD family protein [Agromyces aureus]ANJ27900.1 hypothetical protein ATC03_15425 [Agromyces aureus]
MSITMHVDDEPTPGLGPDGRPDPAYAAALGLVPAPTGRRAAAFTLDAAIWLVLAAPTIFGSVVLSTAVLEAGGDVSAVDLGGLAGPLIAIAVGQALTAVFGLIQLISHGLRGVTVGKAAFGIRSVSVVDFGKAGFWRIVLRALVLWLSWVVLLVIGPALMFLSSNWDPERRGRSWLDRVGRCYAVDARHGLDPFDAKAMRHAQRQVASPREQGAAKPPSLASDRPVGEEFLIPSQRSSSGVVSAGGSVETGQWAPPPVGTTAPPVPGVPSPLPPTAAPVPLSPATQTWAPPAHTAPLPPAAPETASVAAPAPTSAPSSSPPATSAPRLVLAFDDGSRLVPAEYGLLGRAPVAAPGERIQLVPLDDPSMLISKVHAEFGADASGVWIADRGSTNGTDLRHPDGRTETLRAGVRTPLGVGSVVTLGGRSFTIVTEPGR